MDRPLQTNVKTQFRRVAAWIYAVINPILESLQDELALLEGGNLTWRSGSGRCERIRNIQEYVDSKQWPNYFDFRAEHDHFKKSFEEHDTNLKSLNSRAKELYDSLLSSKIFLETLNIHLDTYEGQRVSIGPHAPSINNSRPEIPRVFAENIINNVGSLPSHYMYSFLWNFKNKELLAYRDGQEFTSLHNAAAAMGQMSSGLKAGLEDHRLSLSRQFDVPAAPVAGISFEE